jgi:type II secretory pathway pseudopilin PulG
MQPTKNKLSSLQSSHSSPLSSRGLPVGESNSLLEGERTKSLSSTKISSFSPHLTSPSQGEGQRVSPLTKGRLRGVLAFTLVELIVVITILVILGTIAFTSLTGFSGNARDSSRVSDLTNISKGLDIAYIKSNSYPTPSIPAGQVTLTTVSYSGSTLFSQGTIGDTVINTISTTAGAKLSKKPTDPLTTTKEYIYSLSTNTAEYQLQTSIHSLIKPTQQPMLLLSPTSKETTMESSSRQKLLPSTSLLSRVS